MFDWLRKRILPKELFQTIERMNKIADGIEKSPLNHAKPRKTKAERFNDRMDGVRWAMLEKRMANLETKIPTVESQSGDGEPQELSFESLLSNPKLLERVNELIDNPEKFRDLQKRLKETVRGKGSGWL